MPYRCLHGVAKGWPRLISAFGTGSGVVLDLFKVRGLGPGIYNHETNPNPNPKTNPKTNPNPKLNPELGLATPWPPLGHPMETSIKHFSQKVG